MPNQYTDPNATQTAKITRVNGTYDNLDSGNNKIKKDQTAVASDVKAVVFRTETDGPLLKCLKDASDNTNTPAGRLFFSDANGAATSDVGLRFVNGNFTVGTGNFNSNFTPENKLVVYDDFNSKIQICDAVVGTYEESGLILGVDNGVGFIKSDYSRKIELRSIDDLGEDLTVAVFNGSDSPGLDVNGYLHQYLDSSEKNVFARYGNLIGGDLIIGFAGYDYFNDNNVGGCPIIGVESQYGLKICGFDNDGKMSQICFFGWDNSENAPYINMGDDGVFNTAIINSDTINGTSIYNNGHVVWDVFSLPIAEVDYSVESTVVGCSSYVAKIIIIYKQGKWRWVYFCIEGTSNSTEFNFTIDENSSINVCGSIGFKDNDGVGLKRGLCFIDSDNGLNKVMLIPGDQGTSWTNTGTKKVIGTLIYRIA